MRFLIPVTIFDVIGLYHSVCTCNKCSELLMRKFLVLNEKCATNANNDKKLIRKNLIANF